MKNKIIALVLIPFISISLFIGCGKIEVSLEKTGDTLGNYIIIKETKYTDSFMNFSTEYLVYDKNTKVMYTYTRSAYALSICPYYTIGDNGIPNVAVYNERVH